MHLYTYQNNLYELLFDKSQMKVNDVWIESFIYMSIRNGAIYTIAKSEFLANFVSYVSNEKQIA